MTPPHPEIKQLLRYQPHAELIVPSSQLGINSPLAFSCFPLLFSLTYYSFWALSTYPTSGNNYHACFERTPDNGDLQRAALMLTSAWLPSNVNGRSPILQYKQITGVIIGMFADLGYRYIYLIQVKPLSEARDLPLLQEQCDSISQIARTIIKYKQK